MEGLGTSFIESIGGTLFSLFLPYLDCQLVFHSRFGDWQHGLIVGAIVWSVGGTYIYLIATQVGY